MFKRASILLVFITALVMLESCSYSFTGASVPSHIKTIAIPIVKDRSGSGEPNLSEDFTNKLLQDFIDDNTLRVVDKTKANALLDCTLMGVREEPSVITGNETVQEMKLTVVIKVKYSDLVKKTTTFERDFNNYGTYSIGGDLTSKRTQAIQVAIEKLSEDILLAVVSNW